MKILNNEAGFFVIYLLTKNRQSELLTEVEFYMILPELTVTNLLDLPTKEKWLTTLTWLNLDLVRIRRRGKREVEGEAKE